MAIISIPDELLPEVVKALHERTLATDQKSKRFDDEGNHDAAAAENRTARELWKLKRELEQRIEATT